MGFGGTVPIGNLVAGPIIERTSITAVMLVGAACALALSFYARLEPAAHRVSAAGRPGARGPRRGCP